MLHGGDDKVVPPAIGAYTAQLLPVARYVELPGVGHLALGAGGTRIQVEMEKFLTEVWEEGGWDDAEPDRMLATVLFTDIVESTTRAIDLGDRRWLDLLERHNALVRRQLLRFRGREISNTGDGFLAAFDGPARAIRCACAIVDGVHDLGLTIRAGLHTGECEVSGGNVVGIAVHTGARVAAKAGPDEVLVSSTVRDLVAGSGIEFRERGSYELKGLPGEWRLFAVDRKSYRVGFPSTVSIRVRRIIVVHPSCRPLARGSDCGAGRRWQSGQQAGRSGRGACRPPSNRRHHATAFSPRRDDLDLAARWRNTSSGLCRYRLRVLVWSRNSVISCMFVTRPTARRSVSL